MVELFQQILHYGTDCGNQLVTHREPFSAQVHLYWEGEGEDENWMLSYQEMRQVGEFIPSEILEQEFLPHIWTMESL